MGAAVVVAVLNDVELVLVVDEVFTVASVNMIQSRLTIRRINNMMVVITRIKLVTSLLPLKLKITLVVMVSRFYGAMLVQKGVGPAPLLHGALAFLLAKGEFKAAQSGSLSYVTHTLTHSLCADNLTTCRPGVWNREADMCLL